MVTVQNLKSFIAKVGQSFDQTTSISISCAFYFFKNDFMEAKSFSLSCKILTRLSLAEYK